VQRPIPGLLAAGEVTGTPCAPSLPRTQIFCLPFRRTFPWFFSPLGHLHSIHSLSNAVLEGSFAYNLFLCSLKVLLDVISECMQARNAQSGLGFGGYSHIAVTIL